MKTEQAGLFDAAIPVAQPTPPGRTTVTTYNGDCLDVMPQLETGIVNMFFADLPYGVTCNKWDCVIDLERLWAQVKRVCDKGPHIMTAQQPFTTTLICSNKKFFRYDLVWHKTGLPTGFLNAKRMPLRAHESILMFYKNLPYFNPQKTIGDPYSRTPNRPEANGPNYGGYVHRGHINLGVRNPTSVLPISNGRKNHYHPTQKPVALLEWLIKSYTRDGDTILDPTAGSGTTAIAAMNVGNRTVICIEKDPTYYDIMCKRIAEHRKALGQ